MDLKKCTNCKVAKPFSDFTKHSTTKDKLRCYCRICHNSRTTQWHKNNRGKYNGFYKKRRVEDEPFRLACNLRSRLRIALPKELTRKTSKTEELLEISFQEIKDYIEFLLTSDMSWKNIDLDHVQPLSSYDLTDPEQLKEAAHFSNIQPLLKRDNRKKGANYHEHDLMVQNQNLYEYECFKYYK